MHQRLLRVWFLMTWALLQGVVLAGSEAPLISNLHAASGKTYASGHFATGATQFIDRAYTFDYAPAFLQGATHIQTAGDDKFIDEAQPCLSFETSVPVTVYVVYGDKLRLLPAWLKDFENTRWKATRKDSNPTTLKGLFTLFSKDFPPGKVTLYGNLAPAMAADADFKKMKGSTFCMYSVVVVPQSGDKKSPQQK